MMLINKIIVLNIIASFLLCVHASGDSLTLDEYHGVWYNVATIYPPQSHPLFTCVWSNIIKDDDSDVEFDEIFKAMTLGKLLESEGHGKLVDSELHFSHPSVGLSSSIYTVTKYNDGDEMILHNKNSALYSSLVSRTTTASAEAKEAFENKAAAANVDVTYISHDDCSY